MKKNKYKNPPVIECLIEIHTSLCKSWTEDFVVEKLWKPKYENEYPLKKRINDNFVEFRFAEGGKLQQNIHAGSIRYQFFKKNKSRMIQFGERLCVFNQLTPYPESFNNVLPYATELFKHYIDLTLPEQIETVGLRYINKVAFPSSYDINKYLNLYPNLAPFKNADNKNIPFSLQLNPVIGDNNSFIISLTYDGTNDKEQSIYTLDFYVRTTRVMEPKLELISDWVCKSQNRVEEVFELTVTEEAKVNLFGVEK